MRVHARSALSREHVDLKGGVSESVRKSNVAVREQARKSCLRTVLSRIEVGDQRIRIIGERAALADAITGRTVAGGPARGFVLKWRARRDSNSRPSGS